MMEDSSSAEPASPSPPPSQNQFYHINEVTLSINGSSEVVGETNNSSNSQQQRPALPANPPPIYHNEITIPHVEQQQTPVKSKSADYDKPKDKPIKTTDKHMEKPKTTSDVPTPKPRTMNDAKSPQDATDNGGVDNPSFEPDSNKRTSSFGHPGAVNGGHTKEKEVLKNGELNTSADFKSPAKGKNGEAQDSHAEAVNLELVNMDPHRNGLPVKKETEVDIGDPYDEYFVPVNEHRKYMSVTFAEPRSATSGINAHGLSINEPTHGLLDYQQWINRSRGEKLYVTMDKRTKSRWRKILCWAFGLALLFCGILIAILAATGVILTNDATPIETTPDAARGFNDVKSAGTFGVGGDTGTPTTPSPPLSTVPNIPPPTDMSKYVHYVPNALQGTLVLDNAHFTAGLSNPNSTEFKNLASELERELKNTLFDYQTLNSGARNISVKIVDFKPGSVVVTYRVSWTDSDRPTADPISEKTMTRKLQRRLDEKSGYLMNYHVSQDRLQTGRVPDRCRLDNYGCTGGCHYDYASGDFRCDCPDGQILMEDGKTCMVHHHYYGNHGDHAHNHHDHDHHDHTHVEAEPTAEPTSEPKAESSPYDVERHAHVNFPVYGAADHETAVRTVVEPKAEPEPTAEPTAEPEPKAEPEPSAEPLPTSEPEPKVEPEPTAEPKEDSEPKAEPEPSSESEPTAEPKAEPEPTAEPEPKVEPEPAAEPQPSAEPTAEPKVEPEPTAEPAPPAVISISDVGSTTGPKAEPEPTSEPNSDDSKHEHQINYDHHTTVVEHLPITEKTPESSSISMPKLKIQQTSPKENERVHFHVYANGRDELISETEESMPTSETTIGENDNGGEYQNHVHFHDYATIDRGTTERHLQSHSTLISKDEFKPQPPITTERILNIPEEHGVTELNIQPEPTAVPELQSPNYESSLYEHHANGFVQINQETTSQPKGEEHEVATTEKIAMINSNNEDYPRTDLNYIVVHELNTKRTPEQPNAMKETHENTTIPVFSVASNSSTIVHEQIVPEVRKDNVVVFESVPIERNDSDSSRYFVFIPKVTGVVNVSSTVSNNSTESLENNSNDMHGAFNEESKTTREYPEKVLPLDTHGYSVVEEVNEDPNTQPPETIYTMSMKSVFQEEHMTTPMTIDHTEIKKTVYDNVNGDLTMSSQTEPVIPEQEIAATTNKPEGPLNTPLDLDEILNSHENDSMTSDNGFKIIEVLPQSVQHDIESNEKTTVVFSSDHTTSTMAPNVFSVYSVKANEDSNEETKQNTNMSTEEIKTMSDLSASTEHAISSTQENFSVHEQKQAENISEQINSTDLSSFHVINSEESFKSDMSTEAAPGTSDNMSPFLPEVENNAALINILHKGHDIEVNDTGFSIDAKDQMHIENSTVNLDALSHNSSTLEMSHESAPPVIPLKQDMNNLKDDEITKLFNDVIAGRNFQRIEPIEPEYESHTMVYDAEDSTTQHYIKPDVINDTHILASNINSEDSVNEKHIISPVEHNNFLVISDPSTTRSMFLENVTDKSEHTNFANLSSTEYSVSNAASIEVHEEATTNKSAENSTSFSIQPIQSFDEHMVTANTSLTDDITTQKTVNSYQVYENPEPTHMVGEKFNYNVTNTHIIENTFSTVMNDSLTPINNTENFFVTTINPINLAHNSSETEHVHNANVSIINVNETTPSLDESTTIINHVSVSTTASTNNSTNVTTDTDSVVRDQSTENTLPQEDNFLSVVPLDTSFNRNEEYINKKLEKTMLEESDLNDIDDFDKKIANDHKLQDHSTSVPTDELANENLSQNHFLSNRSFLTSTGTTLNNRFDSTMTTEEDDVKKEFASEGFTSFNRPTRCTNEQHQCLNGTSLKNDGQCINKYERCDGVTHCSDGSDELDCETMGCPEHFRCRNGACLSRHLVCNGLVNCADGSDEIDCDKWHCDSDEFSCGDGSACIPLSWRCDGRAHCASRLDETGCAAFCPGDQFHCAQQGACIPAAWSCDGQSDCLGDEDEAACDCPADSFRCVLGGGCIASAQRCDGHYNCADRSDEWSCILISKTNTTQSDTSESLISDNVNSNILKMSNSKNEWRPVCATGWTENTSQLVCQELGFARSLKTDVVTNLEKFEEYFILSEALVHTDRKILAQVRLVENCDDGLVAVACEEYSCRNNAPSPKDAVTSRIVGGEEASLAQWPSVALVFNEFGTKCTASIVSPKWALSSHSCLTDKFVSNMSKWQLFAGGAEFPSTMVNTSSMHAKESGQVRSISNVVSFPQVKFKQFLYDGDIALLEMAEPLDLGSLVSTTCIANGPNAPREICVVVGWGAKNSSGVDSNVNRLHYLPVPTIPSRYCNSSQYFADLLPEGAICAGYVGTQKSPCYDDEGAPLMCFSEETHSWGLQGTLSDHGDCGQSPHPAIFTSFKNSMNEWIEKTIGNDFMFRHVVQA